MFRKTYGNTFFIISDIFWYFGVLLQLATSSTLRSYSQLALIVIAAGAIYPLLYLRQNFELSILESFNITQTQLRYCSSMLGLIFVITYVPKMWLWIQYFQTYLLVLVRYRMSQFALITSNLKQMHGLKTI